MALEKKIEYYQKRMKKITPQGDIKSTIDDLILVGKLYKNQDNEQILQLCQTFQQECVVGEFLK